MHARTLSKTGNLEPTPRGLGASEVSDLPRQQHYSYRPAVRPTTQSYSRNTKQTKVILLLPVASSSDRKEFSAFAQLRRSPCKRVNNTFTIHYGMSPVVGYCKLFLFYFHIGLQCIWSFGLFYVIPVIFLLNGSITRLRGVTVRHQYNVIMSTMI